MLRIPVQPLHRHPSSSPHVGTPSEVVLLQSSPSEDLEALEQGECGGPAFTLSPGGLDRDQLSGGGGGQLPVAGRAEGRGGGQADRGLVLADEEGS